MTTFLGARACAGGESGVVRVPSEAQPERLAAARATRPRNSRRFIHLISRKSAVTAGARTAAPGGSWRTPWEQPPGASDTDWLSNHPPASHYNRRYIAAGHEPPKSPAVELFGPLSWSVPLPPFPSPEFAFVL